MTEATQTERTGTESAIPMPSATNPNGSGNEAPIALLPAEFVQDLRGRWDRIQTGFVDEPRAAVQQADELVASAIQRLTDSFAEARNTLEHQWGRGEQANTEDLRLALRKYRSFFQRLISV